MDGGASSTGNLQIQILFYILLILGGAYFASAESAYARVNQIRLKSLSDDGNKQAKKALSITEKFDKALSTILIGNNIMHLSSSALATVVVTGLIAQGVFGARFTVYSTILTTVLVFLFSEMLPKSFANANSEKVALAYAGSLSFLMKILTPVAFLFVGIGKLFSRIFGGGAAGGVTESEIEGAIDNAEKTGSIDAEQSDILHNVVDFNKSTVDEIMTMREDILWVDVHLDSEKLIETIEHTPVSRLLVCDGNIDRPIGILNVRAYLRERMRRGSVNIRRVMMAPFFTKPDVTLSTLFPQMSRTKRPFVIVREGGRTLGIVTVEDFLEELVGEIWDEYDVYDKNFIKLGGNRFELSPKMKVREALMRIGAPLPAPAIQKKSLESWLRASVEEPLDEDKGFSFLNLTLFVGQMEDENTLSSVIIHRCDSEEEAKEEIENA